MKQFFLSLFLLCAPIVCFGDELSSLTGTVGYRFIEPIVGATVKLMQGTTVIQSTTTGPLGGFAFFNIDAGGFLNVETFTLQVSGANIITYVTNYQIYANSVNDVVYYLPPATQYTYVSVNVVDQNNDPVDGALVYITQNNLVYGNGLTASGVLNIYGLQLGSMYNVIVSKDNYQQLSVSLDFQQAAQLLNLTLMPDPGSISGIVTNDVFAPINGVKVEDWVNSYVIQSTSTNSFGQYSFATVSAGSHKIIFTEEGYQQGSLKVSVGANQSVTVPNLALEPVPVTINGIIYSDNTQRVLPGAFVLLAQKNNIFQTFTSDNNGYYIFQNVPAGDSTIFASKENYQMQYGGVSLTPGNIGNLNFSLTANTTQLNVSVNSSNVPISGATITVMQDVNQVANVITTEEGQYSLSSLIPGTYTVNAYAQGYQNSSETITITPGEELNLVFDLLLNPASLTGFVKEAITSDPISNAAVTAFQDGNPIKATTTNSNGSYFFSYLPSGDVKIRAISSLYQDDSFDYSFNAGESISHDFLLDLGPNRLDLEVYDLITGNPLPSALITVFKDSSLFSSVIGTNLGIASFTGLSTGTYFYSAQLSGYISNQSEPFSFSGEGEVIVARIGLYSQDEPPRNLEGNIIPNYYGAGVVDVIHNIVWEGSLSPEVVYYNVYGNGVLLGNVLGSETLEFNHHNQNKNEGTTYRVESVNSDGSVSSSVEVILR